MHNRFFVRFLTLIICVVISTKNAHAGEVSYPFSVKAPLKYLAAPLRRSLKPLKPLCYWKNPELVSVIKGADKSQKKLQQRDLRRLGLPRETLSAIIQICRDYTAPQHDETPTPTPSPTQSPTPVPACIGTNGACPHIFATTGDAKPDALVNISGGTFSADTKVLLRKLHDGAIARTITPASIHPALIQVRVPSESIGIWQLRIQQNDLLSDAIYLNAPVIQHVSHPVLAVGDEVTIWGKMLSGAAFGNFHSRIHLVSDTQSIEAQITFEDAFKLKFIVPSGVVSGFRYAIRVSNGLSQDDFGTESKKLLVQSPGQDPLGLKVWWAHEIPTQVWSTQVNAKTDPRFLAYGDGLHDDTASIQAAINFVGSIGGGRVFLPTGTYRITQPLLILRPKVILEGAGTNATIIKYGQGDTSGRAAIYFAENNVKYAGVAHLALNNQNRTGITNGSIRRYSKTGIEKLFVIDVKADLGPDGEGFGFNTDHTLIAGCTIDHQLMHTTPGSFISPLVVSEGHDMVVRGNTVKYNFGRIQFELNKDSFLLDNHFTRNGDSAVLQDRITKSVETGGVEFGFTDGVVVDGNTIDATAPIPNDHFNDGEVLMSQTSIYNNTAWGDISSVTATSITDNGKSWGPHDLDSPAPVPGFDMYVAITRGPGMGQIRKIDHYSSNTIYIDANTPWTIDPQPGLSSYAITQVNVYHAFIVDNRLQYGQQGILIYSGGVDLDIHRNTIKDIGASISIRAEDLRPGTGDMNNFNRHLGWNISISQNIAQSTLGLLPAYIKVNDEQFVPHLLHGVTVLNISINDNDVLGSGAASRGLFDSDGYIYVTAGGAGQECNGATFYPDTPYGVLGAIVADNRLNSPGQIYKSRCTNSIPLEINSFN